MPQALYNVPPHMLGDLDYAKQREQEKLAAKKRQPQPEPGAPETETIQRFKLLAASGVPVTAASVLAKAFSTLLEKISTLALKVAELEKSSKPVHMRNVEKRNG